MWRCPRDDNHKQFKSFAPFHGFARVLLDEYGGVEETEKLDEELGEIDTDDTKCNICGEDAEWIGEEPFIALPIERPPTLGSEIPQWIQG